jgi:dihydrofolate reductase
MSVKINNVEAILAIDSNNGLAKDGKIPWKSKIDMKFFKNKTINNVIVMGSKTLLSLPKSEPLNDRINIVVTNDHNKYLNNYSKYDNLWFVNGKNVINILKHCYKDKTIFIIGGSQIYNLLLPYCSKIWLTRIKTNYDCDLFFNYDITEIKKRVEYEDDELQITQLN